MGSVASGRGWGGARSCILHQKNTRWQVSRPAYYYFWSPWRKKNGHHISMYRVWSSWHKKTLFRLRDKLEFKYLKVLFSSIQFYLQYTASNHNKHSHQGGFCCKVTTHFTQAAFYKIFYLSVDFVEEQNKFCLPNPSGLPNTHKHGCRVQYVHMFK